MPPSPTTPPSHLEGEGVGLPRSRVISKAGEDDLLFDPVGIPSVSTELDIPGIHSVLVFGLE